MRISLIKICLVLCLVLILPGPSFSSVFTLSVTPYEGGYDLQFGKITLDLGRVNREVTVNITSDLGKQYQLVQEFLDPLNNAQGDTLRQNSLVVYGIRGTNRSGTLNIEQEMAVTLSRQVLYTSNQNGDSDSFTLVYGITPDPDIASGSYRGRIRFSLEALDSAQSSSASILNIFMEVESEPTIEVRTASGAKSLLLKPDNETLNSAEVNVDIKGNMGRQFRIIQAVSEEPVSSDGKKLDCGAITFLGSQAGKGMVANEATPLSLRQQIIYTSSPNGESDSFLLKYSLSDTARQKEGRFRTSIKYFLEGLNFSQTRLIDALDLEVEFPRIFDLTVTPEAGGLIQFRDVKPLQPPRKSEVIIEIDSNVGKRYQLDQKVASDLTNKEGDVIQDKYFSLRTESLETKGTLKFLDKNPVKKGDSVLFVSDNDGSPDKFKIIYELELPLDYRAGDYSTRILYSLSEI